MNITIIGDKRIMAKLDKLEDMKPVKIGLLRSVRDGKELAATYPPTRPSQTYVRTGKLGGGWAKAQSQLVERGNTMAIVIRNTATDYGHWVQGAQSQAWMHRKRWKNTKEISDEIAPQAARYIADEIRKVLNA